MQIRALLAAVGLALLGVAWADPGSPPPSPSASASGSVIPRLKCRSFPTDPGAEVDTRDPATDLGRWVLGLEDRGWEVHQVDWEVGQKPTGFSQGYTHVCMIPVPG